MRNACDGDSYQGQPLLFKRGIEVGQVFKLGTKYSGKLDACYLDEQGQQNPCLMGCYGIGINRILASAVELGHDDNGIIWPISIAPFEVLITAVNPDDEAIGRVSQQIYQALQDLGVEVLWDDRALRAGVKFKDADLIGIPIRITIGKRSVAQGNVEIKLRRETQGLTIGIPEAANKTLELIKLLKAELPVTGAGA